MFRGVVALCGTLVLGYLDDRQASDYAVSLLQTNARRSVDAWAGGMNQCRDMPSNTKSGCPVVGNDANQKTPRDCARFARGAGGDGFHINDVTGVCQAILCHSTNLYVTPDGGLNVSTYSDYCGLERARREVPGECSDQWSTVYQYPKPSKSKICKYRPSFNRLAYNNLAAGGMRYNAVLPGTDLIITASDPQMGSSKKGAFGVFKVMSNTSVDVKFQLVAAGTETPIFADIFTLSVFDIDQGKNCLSRSFINVTNYDSYFVGKSSELIVKHGPMESPWASFMSSQRGSKGDEPTGPMRMRAKFGHHRRAVTLVYTNVNSFTVTFGIQGGVAGAGRNFLYAGLSNFFDSHCKGVKGLKQARRDRAAKRAAKLAARDAAAAKEVAKAKKRAAKKRAKRDAAAAKEVAKAKKRAAKKRAKAAAAAAEAAAAEAQRKAKNQKRAARVAARNGGR